MSVAEPVQALTVEDLVARSALLRKELASAGADVDASGGDTALGMRRAFEEGLNQLSVPRAYGGLSDGRAGFALEALLDISTNLSAADSSLCQNWGTNQLVLREIFHAHDTLPESTLQAVAEAALRMGARFMASNAETGSPRPVTARSAPGGIIVSGVKTFNTNSGGGGFAFVGLKHENFEGRYHAIVPLDAKGVRLHHDWDNMGQRGTYSQTITYDDVFVPDGWHFHAGPPDLALLPLALLLHASLLLGCAMGAQDAGVEHLGKSDRVIMKRFKSSLDDPLMMRRVGLYSAKVLASYTLQQQIARTVEQARTPDVIMRAFHDALCNKAICLETALEVTEGLFELVGARATANKNRFDRFWRNARTFAVHDPVDQLLVWVGEWDVKGSPPDFRAALGL